LSENITLFHENKNSAEESQKVKSNNVIAKPVDNSNTELKFKVRIFGVKEANESVSKENRRSYDFLEINKITNHCGLGNLPLRDAFRLGAYKSDATRPRPLLVHFQSVWDVRKLFSSLQHLKTYETKIFISRAVSKEDRKIEKALLAQKHQLIADGTPVESIKIRGLKLFVGSEEVNVENL